MVRRRRNNVSDVVAYDYGTLQKAYDSAKAGDTVHFPPNSVITDTQFNCAHVTFGSGSTISNCMFSQSEIREGTKAPTILETLREGVDVRLKNVLRI